MPMRGEDSLKKGLNGVGESSLGADSTGEVREQGETEMALINQWSFGSAFLGDENQM